MASEIVAASAHDSSEHEAMASDVVVVLYDHRVGHRLAGRLVLYFVDFRDRDVGGYVAHAQKTVASQINFPPGYYVTWSGQFEYLQRAKARLQVVVPVTLVIIFLLLYLNFRRVTEPARISTARS
jgi:Cu/Ag efflux pump CusA